MQPPDTILTKSIVKKSENPHVLYGPRFYMCGICNVYFTCSYAACTRYMMKHTLCFPNSTIAYMNSSVQSLQMMAIYISSVNGMYNKHMNRMAHNMHCPADFTWRISKLGFNKSSSVSSW